jgi:glycine dehydrogenase subunit 1
MPSVPHPYLPSTDDQREEMLRAIGVAAATDLFADIPEAFRDPDIRLPEALSELELRQDLEALAAENKAPGDYASFLGAGAYRHFVPAVVRAMASRGELLTSYTPYQPEVSQGTLQATYDFQSLICLLTSMDVANAGMYDGATALAEAALMACRVTGRRRITVAETVSPFYRQVMATYCQAQGIDITQVPLSQPELSHETACLVVQYPNFYGNLEDLARLSEDVHSHGSLLVVSADPTAMGLFQPPGHYGADIVTGEGQPLGIPPSFGGPYLGLFATKLEYVRQMPSRISGRTVDSQGRQGYVLTLQTREQHIRRERATSNICTNEALYALASTIYLAALGKQGLRQVAELCYHKAHYAASRIAALPGYSLPIPGNFFQEFLVSCPAAPSEINDRLLENNILGGLDLSQPPYTLAANGAAEGLPNPMLLCVTEMNTREEIDDLVATLAEFQ